MNDQTHRRTVAKAIAQFYRCWDDNIDYDNDRTRYMLGDSDTLNGDPPPTVPQYISVRSDETYTTMDFAATEDRAIYNATQNIGEDTLMNPVGVWDLDAITTTASEFAEFQKGAVDWHMIVISNSKLELLISAIDDGIYYRRGDKEDYPEGDPDYDDDNAQANEYIKMLTKLQRMSVTDDKEG